MISLSASKRFEWPLFLNFGNSIVRRPTFPKPLFDPLVFNRLFVDSVEKLEIAPEEPVFAFDECINSFHNSRAPPRAFWKVGLSSSQALFLIFQDREAPAVQTAGEEKAVLPLRKPNPPARENGH
jgi:hypothetical protein